jgi:dethiobiotin synthetase
MPAAPLVAAEALGSSIDLGTAVRAARRGSESGPILTLVEGAGGWRVPLTATADMSGLARELALPVVIVARAGLGTINHSLLTIEAVARDGLQVAALVLSRRDDDDPAFVESNRREIKRRWPGRVLILASDPSPLDALLPPTSKAPENVPRET